MNTENFKPLKNIDLYFIEEKQDEIKFKYEPEAKEIFKNFDIDTFEDQETFKKYSWRIVEELMEALEDTENEQHYKEEIIDAFNFLIELYHLYGWKVKNLKPLELLSSNTSIEFIEKTILELIKQLGLTCNLLKSRQWRKSQYLVDLYVFEDRFRKVWEIFLNLLKVSNITVQELFDSWSKKYQVNLFRINTNY